MQEIRGNVGPRLRRIADDGMLQFERSAAGALTQAIAVADEHLGHAAADGAAAEQSNAERFRHRGFSLEMLKYDNEPRP